MLVSLSTPSEMNGTSVNAVSDSDVFIDRLQGHAGAADVFAEYERVFISRITWIEVMVGARTSSQEAAARTAFKAVDIVEVTSHISELAVAIRKTRRLKLPDAIILATAQALGLTLITRNVRDFREQDPMVRVPYRL